MPQAVDFTIPSPDEVQAVLADNATSDAGDDMSGAPSSMFELESGLQLDSTQQMP